MLNQRNLALVIAVLTALVALVIVVDRSGLIAWTITVLGVALLAKIVLKPSRRDLGLSLGLAALFLVAWFGTRYYVISTWESGEVVELAMNTSVGPHTARLWVLDIGTEPVVYYDAAPEAAQALLAGNPLQLTRAGQVSTRIPHARLADELSEQETNEVLEAMASKYGHRNDAATVYYLMLGRSRDRVAVVATLTESE